MPTTVSIKSTEDSAILQKDLELLSQWATVWQMKFNVSKCIVIHCTRSLTPAKYHYKLSNTTLTTKDQHPYLGILLHKALSWSGHIANIASKASQIFNFLRRNLSKCSSTVKASSYLTLVHPIMEYAASVWDPHHLNDIQALEKVQRRAARWVMNDYSWYSSVSAMLHSLNVGLVDYKHSIKPHTNYLHYLFHLIFSQHKDSPDITTHSTTLSSIQELTLISSPTIQEQLKIGMSFRIIL